jgi:hypothetical protein
LDRALVVPGLLSAEGLAERFAFPVSQTEALGLLQVPLHSEDGDGGELSSS